MAGLTPSARTSVVDALRGVTQLGVDTAPFIYFVEANPTYFTTCGAVFQQIQNGGLIAVTSVLTLTETLPLPLRAGDTVLESAYRGLLLSTTGIDARIIDNATASHAAELRARYGLRTPDALHIATAILAGCEAFLTGDKGLHRVSEIRVLVLDDLKP